MNPIQKAITDVKFMIPAELLQEAFVRREFGRRALPTNVDALIREKVISARVLPDCDMVGGEQVLIPLAGVVTEYVDPATRIYRIPKSLTQNRSITRVLAIGLGPTSGISTAPSMMSVAGSDLMDSAKAVVDALGSIQIVQTATVRLIAENTVMVEETSFLPQNIYLRCYVENDPTLAQLPTTSYHKFTRLVELALKAYIYNTLIIPVGEGQLQGGMELGVFKQVLDSYADSNELYTTYLNETWRRVAVLTDPLSRRRHMRFTVGGRW